MPPAVPARWSWHIKALVGWLLLISVSAAQGAFEVTGSGARTEALGGAFGAGVGAAEGIWINPAANARGVRWQAGTTHALLYPGLEDSPSLNAVVLVAPVAGGGLQAGFSALGVEGWEEQVEVVGYGRAVHPRLALGVDVRSGGWQTGELSHRAWSADLGGIYEVGWLRSRSYLRLGLVMRDLLRSSLAAGGQAEAKPPRAYILAASLGTEFKQMLIDVERRAGRIQLRAGYEETVRSLGGMQLRVGGSAFTSAWDSGDINAGIGYGWREWHLDFSYTSPLGLGGALGGVHRLSLSYRRF
jgi:hypothetical protein